MSFKSTVQLCVTEQCQEVKLALTLFPYFETWEEDTVSECCRLGKIIEVPPDTIILGCEEGNHHMVYFILEGTCRLIQHLQVHVKSTSLGKKLYRMYEPKELHTPTSEAAEVNYASHLFNRKLTPTESLRPEAEEEVTPELGTEIMEKVEDEDHSALSAKEECLEEKDGGEHEYADDAVGRGDDHGIMPIIEVTVSEDPDVPEEADIEEIETNAEKVPATDIEVEITPAEEETVVETEESKIEVPDEGKTEASSLTEEKEPEEVEEEEEEEAEYEEILKEEKELVREKIVEEEEEEEIPEEPEKVVTPPRRRSYDEDHHRKVLAECQRDSVRRVSLDKKPKLSQPPDVESHFIQIGLLFRKACFGLGESLQDRFIISVTKVKYLMVPRHFLLLHNPCNIWNRIRQFLSLYLPSSGKIMQNFIKNREWAESIRKESLRVVSMKSIPNFTLENDVPLFIRITELIIEQNVFCCTEDSIVKGKTIVKTSRKLSSNVSEQLSLSSYGSR